MSKRISSIENIHNEGIEFVRVDALLEIYEALNKGESIKLKSISGMGASTLMQHIYNQCVKGQGIGAKYFAFYVCNQYDQESFLFSINEQLTSAKLPNYTHGKGPILDGLAAHMFPSGKQPIQARKVLFILDDFNKNFTKNETPESILNEKTLSGIKPLCEKNKHIRFIINYVYPIYNDLMGDWYLNNPHSVEVGLLTENEVLEMIDIKLFKKNIQINNKETIVERIIYYGGRHPSIIDKLSSICNYKNFNEDTLIRATNSFLTQICNTLLENEKRLLLPAQYFLTQFNKISNKVYDNDEDKKFNDYIKLFCYEVSYGVDKHLNLFSEYFEEWVKRELMPVNIQKVTHDYEEKIQSLKALETIKSIVDRKIKFQTFLFNLLSFFVFVLLAVGLIFIFKKFDFGKFIEPIKEFLLILLSLYTFFFKIPFSNNFNFHRLITKNLELKVQEIRENLGFDQDKYDRLKKEIFVLKSQLEQADVTLNKGNKM